MSRFAVAVMKIAAMMLLLSGGPVFATGSTHIWSPSTDIQAFKVVHLTSDLYLPTELDAAGNRLPTVTNVGLTVGVIPWKGNCLLEVGFDHKSGLGLLDQYPMYGNAKAGLPEKAFGKLFPAVAVGVLDIGTESDMTNFNVFYGKLAKTIEFDSLNLGRFSLGYFIGNKKLLLDDKLEKDNGGLVVAWERTMPEISDRLWLCVDYMGTKSVYGSLNIGASWKCSPKVSLIGGYDLYNNDALPSTFTVQTDIDF